MLATYETKDYWLPARSGRQTLRRIQLPNREKVVMFMFGGNQDGLIQESASRIKNSIWILWCHHIRFCPANPRTVLARSFLTIVVIKRIGSDESSLRRAYEPFSAVRIITRLSNRVIRNDEENKI